MLMKWATDGGGGGGLVSSLAPQPGEQTCSGDTATPSQRVDLTRNRPPPRGGRAPLKACLETLEQKRS